MTVWGVVLALHGGALAGTAWVKWRAGREPATVRITIAPAPPPPPPRTATPLQLWREAAREPAVHRRVAAERREVAVAARSPRRQRAVRHRVAPRMRDVVLAAAAPAPSGVTAGGRPAGHGFGRAGPPVSKDREAAPLPGCPQPHYPRSARRAGHTGLVLLRVHLDAMGHVLAVILERTSGYDALDHAAREAVIRWRFAPRVRGGATVPCELLQPVSFRLR